MMLTPVCFIIQGTDPALSYKLLISGVLHALLVPDIYLALDERKVLTFGIGSLRVMD